MALEPRAMATFGEQLDSIGRRQPFENVRPTRWNVSFTRIFGVLGILFSLGLLYVAFSG